MTTTYTIHDGRSTVHVTDPCNGETPYRVELGFGSYHSEMVTLWADSYESALEDAADFAKTHWPGVFVEPEYHEAAEGLGLIWDPSDPDDAVINYAEADLTYTESGWLNGWEWHIAEINTAEESLAIDALLSDSFQPGHMRPEVRYGTFDLIEQKETGEEEWAEHPAYTEGQIEEITETLTGYSARLSAPGFLDKTSWTQPVETAIEAVRELIDLYGDAE